MANATPTRLGQNLATGDANALFLRIFSGEVLSAFCRENQMMNMTSVRNIQSGKSASFPVTGKEADLPCCIFLTVVIFIIWFSLPKADNTSPEKIRRKRALASPVARF